MKRLATWPNHRLTLALAACLVLVTGLGATDGHLGWSFWSGVALVAVLMTMALTEKRQGD